MTKLKYLHPCLDPSTLFHAQLYTIVQNKWEIIYVFFFGLYSCECHNYNANIHIAMMSRKITKKNMKITTNYTTITNYHHNMTPNVLVEVGMQNIFRRP
jgi:hypothetical protein